MVPKFSGTHRLLPHPLPLLALNFSSQIIEKDPQHPNGPPQTSLVEIGPRFVLTPIRIFEGAFNGATVFSNPGKPRQLTFPATC